MFFESEEPHESALLLEGSEPLASQSSKDRSFPKELSPAIRLIPVVLVTEFACQLPTTTFVELVRLTVCRVFSSATNGSITFLQDPSPAEHCDTPHVLRYFALVTAILGVVDSLLCAVGYGLLNHISAKFGRRPAFLLLLAGGMLGCSLVAGSQFTPGWLIAWVFLLGVFLRMLSGSPPQGYLATLYITDISSAENRTTALSKTLGWTTLGISISLLVGGFVTTKTGNALIVFYMAAAAFALVFIYILLFLPESLPKEKRDAIAQLQRGRSTNSLPMLTPISSVLEPLKSLAPTRRMDGSRNWRITWLAIHNFIVTVATGYALPGWMVLATSKYHMTPADTGLFFSIFTLSSTVVLIVIVPFLVLLLRPYYARKTAHSSSDEGQIPNGDDLNSGTSDHLNVHLSFVSCVVSGVCFLGMAASTTSTGVIISAICIGFTTMRGPAMSGLIASSVEPLKQGEAFAAFGVVASVGNILSPVIMGSILTATIDSAPLVFFYVHLIVVLFGGVLLFFVRDADRYQESYEALE